VLRVVRSEKHVQVGVVGGGGGKFHQEQGSMNDHCNQHDQSERNRLPQIAAT